MSVTPAKVEAPTLPPGSPPLVADPELLATLLFNTIVIYGPTGSRKTSQIGEFAEYIYEKTGKPTRMPTADGGGYGIIQDYVDAGIIIPWRLVSEEQPLSAIRKMSKGAWPETLVNGIRQGPIKEHLSKDLPKAMAGVGAYAIESWASIATLIMSATVDEGRKMSQDVVAQFVENGEKFGAPSQSHYGFAQKELLGLIRNTSAFPVERILHTSTEGKGEDKMTKTLQYGPNAVGQAVTAIIPTYVGDCLHFEDFLEEKGKDPANPSQNLVTPRVRVWFQQHPDLLTPKMIWPAKTRVVKAEILSFRKALGEQGYFILPEADKDDRHSGLYKYLKTQDTLLHKSTKDLMDWKKGIDAKFAAK